MKEKLIIKNFGPIKSVDLELGKITILIGEQASGKSTVAKVLAICRYFSYITDDSIMPVNHQTSFVNKALRDWGLDGFERESSYIEYKNSDYLFKVESIKTKDNDIDFYAFTPKLEAISKKFKNLLKTLEKLKPERKDEFGIFADWRPPHSFLTTDVKNVMDNPFYFPTERGLQSIFSIGKTGVENITDRLYEQLASLNRIASNFREETSIEPLDLLYKNENNQGYIKRIGENEFFKLSMGASGYKSAIPIVLGLKYYSVYDKRKRTFLIEEPEQNLFPKAQKQLIEFMVSYVNQFDHTLLITTHSPYILTSLENLMYAEKLGTQEKGIYEDKVSKIIKNSYWINRNDVNVYFLGSEGEKDLMHGEDALIDKEYIDSVSEIINRDFDKLLNIELKLENNITE